VRSNVRKLSKAILISSFAAVMTPALGAGMVAGTASAVQVVADASTPAKILDADEQSGDMQASDDNSGPRRLSPLAGNDQRAWSNAKSIHPRLFRKAKH